MRRLRFCVAVASLNGRSFLPVRESAMWAIDAFGTWIHTGLHDSWVWVTGLNMQEWFLLLGVTSLAGFLCMRGFGSRTNY